MFRRGVVRCLVAVCAAVVFPMGSAASSSAAGTVDIYSSVPLGGPSNSFGPSVLNGIKLALAQAGGKAGQFRVKFVSLDATGHKNPAQEAASNARTAARDPRAVYYIGDLNSGPTEVSIPILNKAGIPQVTPSASYPGLTVNEPGVTAPGEPGKYYPTGKRTFLRLAANDTVEAAALLTTMSSDRCQQVAIADDNETYGSGMAAMVKRRAGTYGVHIASITTVDLQSQAFGPYIQTLTNEHADCFLFSGVLFPSSSRAVELTNEVAAALPAAKLYGPDGVCTSAFTDPAHGGIPPSAGRRFTCTHPTLALSAYPGGHAFLAAYKAKYATAHPDPYAIYGYEAMKLGLDTIAKLGAKGNRRSAILHALFATKNRHSVLGTYSFDRNGDTTLRSFGLYKVSPQGLPVFVKNVNPR